MLTECENDLRLGDVIVVSPEYPEYGDRFWGEPDALLTVIESRPRNFEYLGAHQIREFLDKAFLNRAGIVVRAAFMRTDRQGREYSRFGFNSVGDMVAHYNLQPKKRLNGNVRFTYNADVVENVVGELNQFAERCQKKGAKVFLSHPPLAHSQFTPSRDELLKLESHLQRSLKIPMLDSMLGADLADENFYDTAFHLNRPAVIRRSTALADELNSRLQIKQMAKSPSGT
jgi:hypothetical protein